MFRDTSSDIAAHMLRIVRPSPEVIKNFFVLDSAEHEIISANKYENANNMAFSNLLAEKFSCSAMFRKKNLQL